jgi:hypothetical protein
VKRYEQLMRAAHSFRRLAKKQPHLRVQHMKMAKLGMERAARVGDAEALTPDSGKYLNDKINRAWSRRNLQARLRASEDAHEIIIEIGMETAGHSASN